MIWVEPSLDYLSSIGSSKINFIQVDKICQDFPHLLHLNLGINVPNGLEVIAFGDVFTAFCPRKRLWLDISEMTVYLI